MKKQPIAIAVRIHGAGWEVKIPNRHKSASKWYTVCDCYCSPIGSAEETAIRIAAALNPPIK